MTHNTSKFQIGGGLESADIGVLVRGVKNENFPCPARLRALKGVNQDPTLFQDLKVRVCQTKSVDPNDLIF